MSEENKAIARRFLDESINQHNLSVVDELFANNGVVYHPAMPEPARGHEAIKQAIGMFLSAFPDLWITVDDLVSEDDKVAARFTFGGTHKGDFAGIPPSGKSFSVSGMAMYRITGGKIVEDRVAEDVMGMMRQIGAIPSLA